MSDTTPDTSSAVEALAERLRLSVADLTTVSQRALELLPERWARKFNVLPLAVSDRRLTVAMSDPLDLECERTLAFATGRQIVAEVASRDAIARRIDELYRTDGPPESAGRGEHFDVEHLGNDHESPAQTLGHDVTVPVATLVDQLIAQGIAARASDIHIESEERSIAVRHRIDGVLRLARSLPRSIGPSLVSRIKIMSSLDIADRLRPQDGGARVAVNGVAVDLRISTLPASHGEKVVIRVLDSHGSALALEAIGIESLDLARIERLLEWREGLILVTGPTGSGKTTTLYAALRRLKDRGVNIVTVEDPIEYRIPGIVQVQVNEKAGLTFAAALRSIMRQDPDVLLIGEIRDRETAEIAIQASLTGHLVLSTLHTNDAVSAVTRLVDIGVTPHKIATAVKGVIAQRLVRRLCTDCGGTSGPSSASGAADELAVSEVACRGCGGSGLRGRLPIAEVLIGSPELEAQIAAGATLERLSAVARASGMRTLWAAGMAHAAAGVTTTAEVARVATPDAPLAERGAPNPRGYGVVAEPSVASRAFAVRPEARRSPRPLPAREATFRQMAELSIGAVAVLVVHPLPAGWRVLLLQRSENTRCRGTWEAVHGRIEQGEQPEDAAIREVLEETGLVVERLYNVMAYPFYLHRTHVVEISIVFAAFVATSGAATLGTEHQRFEWLSADDALERFHWPREREALVSITQLLSGGDAGTAEDVLRVF